MLAVTFEFPLVPTTEQRQHHTKCNEAATQQSAGVEPRITVVREDRNNSSREYEECRHEVSVSALRCRRGRFR
jgi:hypothetical protein